MKTSAILPGLLICLLLNPACEKLQEGDPWAGFYGDYFGTTELYKAVQPENPADPHFAWVRMNMIETDTISIMRTDVSPAEENRLHARLVWNGACSLLPDCNHTGHIIYELELSDYQGNAYKSDPGIMFIPRAQISPKSEFRLEELPLRLEGLETFGESGLYFFDFSSEGPEPLLLLFTGQKDIDGMAGGVWRRVKLWGQEKQDREYRTPGS